MTQKFETPDEESKVIESHNTTIFKDITPDPISNSNLSIKTKGGAGHSSALCMVCPE